MYPSSTLGAHGCRSEISRLESEQASATGSRSDRRTWPPHGPSVEGCARAEARSPTRDQIGDVRKLRGPAGTCLELVGTAIEGVCAAGPKEAQRLRRPAARDRAHPG